MLPLDSDSIFLTSTNPLAQQSASRKMQSEVVGHGAAVRGLGLTREDKHGRDFQTSQLGWGP